MRHSVIAWDASYRDFFNLVNGLRQQAYETAEYELVFVEQRSQEFADQYAEEEGVQPLSRILDNVADEMNLRVEYLEDPPSNPYHLGKCVNRGIEIAEGEILSVMDGDQLLPSDFLQSLDRFYNDPEMPSIANIARRTATEPVGVDRSRWKEATIDFELCLENCPSKDGPIPTETPNYGPLISAPREAWEAVNGYSTHAIWSTGLSKLGADVNRRLELHLGETSRPMPDTIAVHPWHPTGFNRRVLRSKRLFDLQQQLIDWAVANSVFDWRDRESFTEELYQKHREFVEELIHAEDLALPGMAEASEPTIVDTVRMEFSSMLAAHRYSNENLPRYLKSRIRDILL